MKSEVEAELKGEQAPERIWLVPQNPDGSLWPKRVWPESLAAPTVEYTRTDSVSPVRSETLPLCTIHLRMENRGTLEAVYGNHCVACSLNERVELLNTLAGDNPPTRTDSVTFLRELIAERDSLKAQVEGLREALKETVCKGCDNRIGYNELPSRYGNWQTCGSCRAARTALKESEGK